MGKLIIYRKEIVAACFRLIPMILGILGILYINIFVQDAVVLRNKLLYAIESGAGFELS